MNIVTTPEALDELVRAYEQVDAFVFDIESWGNHRGNPRLNAVAWISLATDGRVDVIPMGHPNGEYLRTEYPILPSAKIRVEKGLTIRASDYSRDERKAKKIFSEPPAQLTPAEVFSALKPLFFSDKLKVGHNVKFDLQSVTKYLGELPYPRYACTLVASFVLDNRNRLLGGGLGLDDCLKREFGYEMVKGVGKEIEAHSFDDVATYSGLDAEWTWKLWRSLSEKLKADGLSSVFRLEMDVLEVVCSMELRGADIDVAGLRELKGSLETQVENAKGNIFATAGKVFNINSVPEKQRLLFSPKSDGGRGLRTKVLTPKGKEKQKSGQDLGIHDYAVSEPALEALRGKDLLVDHMLTYADLNKLLSTYVVPYLGGDVTRTTSGKSKTTTKESMLVKGRIHGDFVQYGAETGRFSSRNPNLQNIPNPRTENGKAIRNLFIAPEGHSLVVADYSQIEPRIIAEFSKDRTMVGAYMNGEDIYTALAAPLGVDRSAGKMLVLAMSYGVGPDKIASSIGVTVTEARELLDEFEHKFPALSRYKRFVVAECRRRTPVPYAQTILKRRRYIPELRDKEPWKRSRAERQAFNTVIQGSAADLIKVAMVRAHAMIPEQANLILTVHDELVTVTPTAIAEETAEAIRGAMEGIKVLSIPLLADVKIVERWGDAK